jgi:lipocalin-like protein
MFNLELPTGRAEILSIKGGGGPAAGAHLHFHVRARRTRAGTRKGRTIMNRGMVTLSAIAVLGLALLPSSIVAQQKSLKEQLVGTWMLTKLQPLGANPKGIIIFDAGGRYTRIAGRSDRPRLSPNLSEVTPQEFRAVLNSFGANFGTWSVDEADKTLIVRVEGASNPNLEGAERKDKISLNGDELRIQGPDPGQAESVLQRAK